jgi:hypothetical protein
MLVLLITGVFGFGRRCTEYCGWIERRVLALGVLSIGFNELSLPRIWVSHIPRLVSTCIPAVEFYPCLAVRSLLNLTSAPLLRVMA